VSLIAHRLIERYEKLLFVPGGNQPGFGLVAEEGLAAGVVSVGAYQSRDSYRMNLGIVPESNDNMHFAGLSHGPSGIGDLKPDLLAPSGEMSLDLGFLWLKRKRERRGLYQLPPGYSVSSGTSEATPMAAAVAALVLSAAKQTGVPHDAMRLKAALLGSARYMPALQAFEQGNGLIQVEAAYNALKRRPQTPAVSIASRAPVRTSLSTMLSTPNVGLGLYEREGWAVGDTGTRIVTFTRVAGPPEPMTFQLNWRGNDGTFATPSSVQLPLNTPTHVAIKVSPTVAGAHSAILSLDYHSLPIYAAQMLATVVAAYHLSSEGRQSITAALTVPTTGDRGIFVDVPAGVRALRYSGTSHDGSPVPLRLISPSRDTRRWPTCANGATCVVVRPEVGVWEINVNRLPAVTDFDPSRVTPAKPVSVRIATSLVGADVSYSTPALRALVGQSFDVPVTITNRFAAMPMAIATSPLQSARSVTKTIRRGEQQMFEMSVPTGTTSLRARITDVADRGSDLDVYLFSCASTTFRAPSNCAPAAKSSIKLEDGEVEIVNPMPGRWVAVVDAYHIPSGQTSYTYFDVFANGRLGALVSADVEALRGTGASWSTSVHGWVASLPETGRSLWARLMAVSPGGLITASIDFPIESSEAR
jgi:hypothetical protein